MFRARFGYFRCARVFHGCASARASQGEGSALRLCRPSEAPSTTASDETTHARAALPGASVRGDLS